MTKLRFHFGKSDMNYHGTQEEGEPWNKKTITGPKFVWLKLAYHPPTTGSRVIFYFPKGSWWYLDITFDRRNLHWEKCNRPDHSCWFKRWMGL